MKRSFALLLGAFLITSVILLPGCRKQPGKSGASGDKAAYDPTKDPLVNPPELTLPYPKDHPETVEEDEVLVRLMEANPNTMNPIFGSSLFDQYLESVLFDSPFNHDANMNWFVNTNMVESIQESEDHLVHTVKLKPGLKWHDGQPLTARDIRFTFQAIMDERVPVTASRSGVDQIADVQAIDDLTVKYIHKAALPTNKWNMEFSPIPEHIYGVPAERQKDPSLSSSDYYSAHNRHGVVGNGPYKMVEWITNDRIVVERWDGFHGPKPHFKRQIFKIQPDDNVSLLLFKKGDLDEMRLTSPQFAQQTNDADFAKRGVKGFDSSWSYSHITWNMDGSNPFFADRNVRRALAHAIDLQDVIRKLSYGLSTPCYGIFHPSSWMFNKEVKLLGFNLDQAASLLDQAGWVINAKDGWRYKDVGGKPIKFEFELLVPQGSDFGPNFAAIYAQNLKSIGISLQTRVIEWATFMEMVEKHNFQAEISSWGTGTDPDTNWNLWVTDQREGGRNNGGYSNKRVDELFVLARNEFNQDKRAEYYREIQAIIYEDQPSLFIWNRPTLWAFDKRIHGVQFSPREVFGFSPGVQSWWVSKNASLRK